MTDVAIQPGALRAAAVKDATPVGTKAAKAVSGRTGRMIVWIIAALWTVPTFGLFISSFRPEKEIKTSGWWNVFAHPKFTTANYSKILDTPISGQTFSTYFWNTVKITIPGVIIPIAIASNVLRITHPTRPSASWLSFRGTGVEPPRPSHVRQSSATSST